MMSVQIDEPGDWPEDLVFDVEERVFATTWRCRRPDGVTSGDTGWVRADGELVRCKVAFVADDWMTVDVVEKQGVGLAAVGERLGAVRDALPV